tara:strand:- start:547 stop:1410 length:864 start_codon:yes stop_codon:yes gene_type:complete
MQQKYTNLFISLMIPCVLLGISTWIDSYSGNSLPILTSCVVTTLFVHFILGIPSVILKTEKIYDLTGSIAVWSMMITAAALKTSLSSRATLLMLMGCLWTTRLGAFLALRIHHHKVDRRFNQLKQQPINFILAWAMSAAWTFVTLLSALTAIISDQQQALYAIDYVFAIAWLMAFLMEAIADWQKLSFKKKRQSTPFICSGLWYYSRHPNYFAEICMWFLVAGLAVPNLNVATSICLVSPLFVYWLLTSVSGVNLLEQANDKKFGDLAAYKKYKSSTPCLIPNIWKR